MILVDGKQQETIPADDRGFQYGDGVWETILVKDGVAIFLEEHLDRLFAGLQKLDFPTMDRKAITEDIEKLADSDPNTITKIVITRGSGGRGYNPPSPQEPRRIVSIHPIPEFPPIYHKIGIALTLCETRLAHNPRLAGFKHLNRLEQVMARSEFDQNFQEGLVRDYSDNVIEGTTSNVFLLKDNTLITPNLENCGIKGIMQGYIVRLCSKLQLTVEWRDVSVEDVEQADAVFMSNSVIGIWPVETFDSINHRTYYQRNRIIKKIQEEVRYYS